MTNGGSGLEAFPVGGVDLVSTDVFDTLLLRTTRSERSRLVMGERLFARSLASQGWNVSPDLLLDVRLEAQRLAFRALQVGAAVGEVRLVDVIARQLGVLGLPERLTEERLQIELQVEKRSLRANATLAASLRAHRSAGARIVAISDTTLPSRAVCELIRHFHGPDLIDAVYSSADLGLTKRDGDLFAAVADVENIRMDRWLHVGDDPAADVQAARARGLAARHLPRAPYRRRLRTLDGAVAEAGRVVRRRSRGADVTSFADTDATAFGREVLGPIVAQFCQQIWLYADQAGVARRPVLLFCARGGIGMRQAFERVLQKLGLPLAARRENLMVSRLVAARAALLTRSACAIEELEREFRGAAFAEVAEALGGQTYELAQAWRRPFAAEAFFELLFGASGADVLRDVRGQNALFEQHLAQLAGDADRLILCDTGLYGSTQRLLAAGLPGRALESVHLARSNYKGYSEAHFLQVTGLLVERNGYSPLDGPSCVLRYWQLIESLFEPALPSVRVFSRDGSGQVVGNCGDISHEAVDASLGNRLLTGVMAYIDALPAGGGIVVRQDAERAWSRLKRAIIRPSRIELECLDVGARSVDFGRAATVNVFNAEARLSLPQRLRSIKLQLWREGVIAREFPVLKHVLLPLMECAQSLRGMRGARAG